MRHFFGIIALQVLMASVVGRLTLQPFGEQRTPKSIHLPIVRLAKRRNLEARDIAMIGLGDSYDVMYSTLIEIGGTTTPLMIDTGSSDLWVVSDDCSEGCNGTSQAYRRTTLKSAEIDVRLSYGDSRSGTFASGQLGSDNVRLGTFDFKDQTFAVINRTNTTLIQYGLTGIVGLGFPINSEIWPRLFRQQIESTMSGGREATDADERPPGDSVPPSESVDSSRSKIPSFANIFNLPSVESRHRAREPGTSSLVKSAFASWSVIGPFLPRLVMQGALAQPMVAISLQRNSIDVGGNLGMMSIGDLPAGVNSSEMTWVPLRGYSSDMGGAPAPADSPSEVYPLTWEVIIDDVYLDGERLQPSTLIHSSIGHSALIDTGSSLIRGPPDVVSYIQRRLGPKGLFSCKVPHILAFKIGGKLFPVDPRDFATPAAENNVDLCNPNIVSTDPPQPGGFLFSWSLGIPFLKGVLSAYYYGNLTYPSRDPPRLGFLSTIPDNAQDLMKEAVTAASKLGRFPSVLQVAPSGAPLATPSKPATRNKSDGDCSRVCLVSAPIWLTIFIVGLITLGGQW